MTFATIPQAIADIRAGKLVVSFSSIMVILSSKLICLLEILTLKKLVVNFWRRLYMILQLQLSLKSIRMVVLGNAEPRIKSMHLLMMILLLNWFHQVKRVP